jgi:hypothetical protein
MLLSTVSTSAQQRVKMLLGISRIWGKATGCKAQEMRPFFLPQLCPPHPLPNG